MPNSIKKPDAASVIHLADRASESIDITELEPQPKNGLPVFIGKRINGDGSVTQYPLVTWWYQRVARVPASIPHLFAYLSEARTRNICLIRGAPANPERQPTRRQKAHVMHRGKDRGDHGFVDEATSLFFLDCDGARVIWRSDPQAAIERILTQLGEPWCSASCVWFFSATHGLEFNEHKRWTGKISNNKMRVRLAFIADRALTEDEAIALTSIAKARVPELDSAISRQVQPNYIKRPYWIKHPGCDPLGDLPTIGRIKRARERLTVPDDLAHQARWARAQGQHSDIADHPDAESAVRGIGIDGFVRRHLKSAVVHLLNANPIPEVTSFADHSINVVAKLRKMVETHRTQICENLAQYGRGWADVDHYLPDNMIGWAHWLLDHPTALNRKTIRLVKDESKSGETTAPTLEAICERVGRAIERARKGEAPIERNPFEAYGDEVLDIPMVELVAAPTGSMKSTLMRAAAVRYVTEHPDRSVAILVPRHNLSEEQTRDLMREHPDYDGGVAIWRGRHRDDPEAPDPQHLGELLKMCLRSKEAEEIERAMLSVERNLCKQGRGEKANKCPLYDECGYQRQKQIAARIWFAAHESMVHEMPKAFGKVGWVVIDESPLDAFIAGADEPIELALDALRDPPPSQLTELEADTLRGERDMLYKALDTLRVPIDRHKGVPAARSDLDYFTGCRTAHRNLVLELKGKAEPEIRPDMTAHEVRRALESAQDNATVFKRAMLWRLVEEAGAAEAERCGRIQVHRYADGNGRMIRMCGLKRLAKGWKVQTLILDATGDPDLLRAIWPQLEAEEEPWPQLPRPAGVRLLQVVDRSISKYAIAVESRLKDEEKRKKDLAHKGESARRMHAALLLKALAYGGARVAAIVYKSTEAWIRENCFVPKWLTLTHHGDVTGTNAFADVRALFEIGRMQPPPEAMVRQAEALFGEFISRREYAKGKGRIPIVADEAGNTAIEVVQYRHRNPMVQKLLWQVREGGSIQNAGRTRAGRRDAERPLDIHRWTDVPVPELGPVEPVLWGEVEAGPDGLMLATGGVWLESIPDAGRAYKGLFTANSLKSDRRRGEGATLIRDLLLALHPHLLVIHYHRTGAGRRLAKALSLRDPAATRAWLEEKLGPLASFEVVGEGRKAGQGTGQSRG